ncbi:MAG TPA: hypothetical protein VKC65_01720 [Gaiellaceae bacterium]|nr:hypothetical protein [Gaiellaceae bacterium]
MRRSHRLAGLATGLAALVLVLGLTMGATASTSATGTRLFAYVVPAATGPLHVNDTVWYYIYVANGNRPANVSASRMTLPNAFVVDSVEQRVFVDGSEYSDFTFHPPPNVEFPRWAGRWVNTVTCDPGTPPPCTSVGQPAVIPGENTAVLFPGWVHGSGEPNGTYVFRYTVHGTQNGASVDLTASSPPIQMID